MLFNKDGFLVLRAEEAVFKPIESKNKMYVFRTRTELYAMLY